MFNFRVHAPELPREDLITVSEQRADDWHEARKKRTD
jgi:hypothetical protein